MPTSYTSLLNLALPVTGELSGTWGDTVNDYITKYVDSSVAGTQTISGTQTAVTLTRASGASLSQAGSGSTGSSQYAIINCTGSPASTLTITVDVSTGSPTLSNSTYSQTFAVINATSTSQSVVVRATTTSGTSTGVTLVSGEKALIAWNGSDFTKIATSTADGVTTFSAGTTGFTPSTATSGAVTLAGTLATTNGGTGLTSFTSNGAVYATSTSALTTGTLPVASGGTGLTSGTSGGVLAFTASGTLASSNALAANAIVIGGGAGVAPSTTTTGTGVLTAVGNAVNTTGGVVTQSGTLAASSLLLGGGASTAITSTTTGTGVVTAVGNAVNTTGGLVTQSGTLTANNILLGGGASTAISSSNLLSVSAAVTTGNYIKAIGYADTVTALGNTGTAINLDVTSGGVFTATLTGNATITLRYPVSSGSSSFTLILTNDGTAGRTVAWSGGSFKFPGGAASLSRTTTANAVDIWVFFTPDGGTTWYGNIAMKNMTA